MPLRVHSSYLWVNCGAVWAKQTHRCPVLAPIGGSPASKTMWTPCRLANVAPTAVLPFWIPARESSVV